PIILAAGLGTRMKSVRAKVLHELSGESMIAGPTRAVAALGANPVILVVGHQAAEVEAAARRACPSLPLKFALQPRQQGTGHAARCGLEKLDRGFRGDVLLGYGDLPMLRAETLADFLRWHRARVGVLSFISLELEDPSAYGRVVRDDDGSVVTIVEARD